MLYIDRMFLKSDKSETKHGETKHGETKHGECINLDLPWHANDIYLEDRNKMVKAVCSNGEISEFLSECVANHSIVDRSGDSVQSCSNMSLYKKLVQDAYYLYVAMTNARIPVSSIETAFVQKAFTSFAESLQNVITGENLTFQDAQESDISIDSK